MKQKLLDRILALTLSGAMLLPAVFPVAYGAEGATAKDDFYQSLSELLNDQDYSAPFNTISLTIGSNTLIVDGEEQQMDVAPEAHGGRTMLPIAAVAEAAGADVDYDAANNTAIINGANGEEIRCPIGTNILSINGEDQILDVSSYARSGRTYLPLRAVANALDLDVDWDQSSATVTLTAPYQSARIMAWADKLDARGLNAKTILNDGSGLWVLQFATPADARSAADTLSAQGIAAEPDIRIPLDDEIVPDRVSLQGGHYSWGVAGCHFDSFISQYANRFSGSGTVAVIDTGVDSSHPFLRGRVLSGYNCVDGDTNTQDIMQHGTHVAATIIDCVGSAPVNILPVRVFQTDGYAYATALTAGIKYAADQGADVINMSLGHTRSGTGEDVNDSAIKYAVGKGSLVVVSAGNEDGDTWMHCPSHNTMAGTVVVSAGDSAHNKASFSNYGTSVDLMAPGVNIKAAVPGNSYKTMSGTSMAAPHASAAAALLDLVWGDALTPGQLESKVRSATSGGGTWTNQYIGCGFLDMSKAEVPSAAPTVVSYRYSAGSLSLKIGETAGLKVTAVYSDGSTKDVTSSCGLYSTNTGVAIVSGGTITALRAGTAHISMKSGGVSLPAPVTVTVTDPGRSDTSLTVTGASNITTGSVRLEGILRMDPDILVAGVYLGSSPYSMTKKASSLISVGNGPVKLSYDLSGLSASTTYYYKFYVEVDGLEYVSAVRNFTTSSAQVKKPPATDPPVTKPPVTGPIAETTATGYVVGADECLAINDKAAVSPGWSNQLGTIPNDPRRLPPDGSAAPCCPFPPARPCALRPGEY